MTLEIVPSYKRIVENTYFKRGGPQEDPGWVINREIQSFNLIGKEIYFRRGVFSFGIGDEACYWSSNNVRVNPLKLALEVKGRPNTARICLGWPEIVTLTPLGAPIKEVTGLEEIAKFDLEEVGRLQKEKVVGAMGVYNKDKGEIVLVSIGPQKKEKTSAPTDEHFYEIFSDKNRVMWKYDINKKQGNLPENILEKLDERDYVLNPENYDLTTGNPVDLKTFRRDCYGDFLFNFALDGISLENILKLVPEISLDGCSLVQMEKD